MQRFRLGSIVLPILIAALAPTAFAQTDLAVSPFVALPTSTTSTVAGLGLTLAGTPDFALRATGRVALKNTYTGAFGAGTWMPAWGGDVDAVAALSGRPFGSHNRTGSTFVFIGVGAAARDTADARLIGKSWSYGVGTMLPLGSVVDLFAESRWRMSRFVLPTAKPKPSRTKEIRFGMSFHVHGNGRS